MASSRDLIEQAKASVSTMPDAKPSLRRAIVTCMDARLDPLRIAGALVGDLHVFRNAGGLVTGDTVRSLLISQHLGGTTRIDVVMHTDCAVLDLDGDRLSADIARATGAEVGADFGGFADLERRLHESVEALRSHRALLHRDHIAGHIYDVADGRLHTVVAASQ